MRVIIYVPPSPGAARTRRAVEREVRKRGHEVVGITASRAEAQLALSSSFADQVAGRPEHLLDLAPSLMGIPRTTAGSAGALLLLPITWLIDQVRERPMQGTVIAATLAGAASVSMTLTPTIVPTPPEVLPPSHPVEVPAESPRPQRSASPPSPGATPSSGVPPSPVTAIPIPTATTTAGLIVPTLAPGTAVPSPGPGGIPSADPPRPSVPADPPPPPSPARGGADVTLPSPEPSRSCQIHARTDPTSIRVCVRPPSGLD
jgi:hypothetical protein